MNATNLHTIDAAYLARHHAPYGVKAPEGRASRRELIESFNNVCDYAHTYVTINGSSSRDGYSFRATSAVAKGLACLGFDVWQIGADRYVAAPAS